MLGNNDTLITIDFYANRKSILNLPDGPQTPLWLETLQFVLHPVEYLEARHKSYGDAFTLGKNTDSPVVYLSHPEALKELFTADPKKFSIGHSNKLYLQPLLGANSLFVLDGETHQRQRRLLMPPFHGERMRGYGQLIRNITRQVIKKWTVDRTVSMRSVMQEISLTVILQVVFGLHEGERYDLLRQLLCLYADSIQSPINAAMLFLPALRQDLGDMSPWGRFVRLRQQIDRLLYSEIQERRQQLDSDRNDILTLLLMARDEAGQPMSDTELRDELMTLLFAGHETTTSALTWAMYWIHHLPEVKNKLLSEIDTLSPDADPSTISRLSYLTAVCQETLRIYPVGVTTLDRIVKVPIQIMDYEFEPGTVLTPCIYLAHQREDLYPEPKSFKPERFLARQFSVYEYLPFGGGNRNCIGMALTQFEMKLVLTTILSDWQMVLTDRQTIKPVRRGVTVAPSGDLQMTCSVLRKPQKKALAVL